MKRFFLAPRLILATGAVLLAAYLVAMVAFPKPNGRIVVGDAVHHFVQLRSAVFDRDLRFQNEYVRIYGLAGDEPGTEWIFRDFTPTGHVRNYMPVGPALLWAPAYVSATIVLGALSAVGIAAPPTGYERSLLLIPGVMGVVLVTAAAWLAWCLARRRVAESPAIVAVLAIWLGSHALYYSLVSPAYSHAASMFAASLFFWRWMTTRQAPSLGRAAEWGALAGLAALMRWQDATFLLVLLVDLIRWRVPAWRRMLAVMVAGLGWTVAFAPQMAVWMVLYGQPFALPQGPAFMQWTAPHPWAVLFSDNHGLLTWAPILVLSLAGLWRGLARAADRSARWPVLCVLLTSWYVNAAVADWWAGEAFGARRFLSLFPLFVLGLAGWLQPADGARVPKARMALAVGLTAANWLLLLQYQVFMKGLVDIAPYPHGWADMWLTRFLVPLRILGHWMS